MTIVLIKSKRLLLILNQLIMVKKLSEDGYLDYNYNAKQGGTIQQSYKHMPPIRKNIRQQDFLEDNFDNKEYNKRKNFKIIYVLF